MIISVSLNLKKKKPLKFSYNFLNTLILLQMHFAATLYINTNTRLSLKRRTDGVTPLVIKY